ncbi:DUF551 domain-containing protein [Laribacter hongkongensis]|uniref:DUF551 domain-containing protein n=1 Tax=Laribacter hongkongensis TaxID=168471 RepID=UPI0028207738|nr:DUF551 domain-containing protein [Laribacter hongkongensis]
MLLAFGRYVTVGRFECQSHIKNPNPFWNETVRRFGSLWCRQNQPTHWMPLPAPPKQDQTK